MWNVLRAAQTDQNIQQMEKKGWLQNKDRVKRSIISSVAVCTAVNLPLVSKPQHWLLIKHHLVKAQCSEHQCKNKINLHEKPRLHPFVRSFVDCRNVQIQTPSSLETRGAVALFYKTDKILFTQSERESPPSTVWLSLWKTLRQFFTKITAREKYCRSVGANTATNHLHQSELDVGNNCFD